MKCRGCGAELKDDAKFCAFCGMSQDDEGGNRLGAETDVVSEEGEVQASDSLNASADVESDKQDESPKGIMDKQAIKKSAVFLTKWLGVCAAILLALFVVAVIAGCIAGTPSSLSYRACALAAVALVAAVPYAIAVIVLTVVGESRRTRVSNAIRKIKDKKPAVFKGCVAVFAVVLLVALFFLTPCRHSEWTPATCTAPKTCNACGETEGEALGHDWAEATCTSPKTCSRCGVTEGEARGHVPGEWQKEKPDYSAATITTVQKCSACGAKLDSKKEDITSFVDGEMFSIPASDFVKRMDKAYSSISGCSLKADSSLMKDGVTMSLDVKSGSKKIAAAGFVVKGSSSSLLSVAMSGSEGCFWEVLFSVTSSSKSDEYAAETMYALIQACDPSLTKEEAHDVGSEVIANYESLGSGKGMGQASKNGITYTLANSNGWMVSAKVG